jgi:3'-phosphoadenosine 5'-phosphosulfate sulfotransferase (PAPS reductase)/FAD synthetase
MTEASLFPASDAWRGDPLEPGLDTPTPLDIVLGLSHAERIARVDYLINQAYTIYEDAIETHADGHKIVASVVLFSGGNDSTVLAHLFKDVATHAAHANTGIGVEQTRQFVRDVCTAWGLPLIEKHPPVSYRELVIDQGFPGPAMHFKMYQRLKERCLEQVRRDLVKNGRKERVVYIAGRRRAESARRADVPLHERNRSVIWASPIAMWTKPDMETYRHMMGDVPVNPASVALGMSGECLCGAFAKPGELDRIGNLFPEVRAEIEDLECAARNAGHREPFCRWGHGEGTPSWKAGPMCTSCTLPDPLFDLMKKDAS